MDNNIPQHIPPQQNIPPPAPPPLANTATVSVIDLNKINANPIKRLLALFIDLLLLELVGFIISIPLGDLFFTLSQNGWWIGFFIAMAYFSMFGTSVLKGQTPGYKILRLAVVNIQGDYLNASGSIVRSLLLLFFLGTNEIGNIIGNPSNMYVLNIINIIIFSYTLTFIAFIIFHPQHRGIHDLASGAIVVRKKAYESLNESGKQQLASQVVSYKKATVISTILIVIVVIGEVVSALITPNLLKNPFFHSMTMIMNAVNKDAGVEVISVVESTSGFYSISKNTGSTTKSLVITTQVNRDMFIDPNDKNKLNTEKLDMLDAKIKKQAAGLYPQINEVDQVQVVFNSGYDIGIWAFNEHYSPTPSSPQSLK